MRALGLNSRLLTSKSSGLHPRSIASVFHILNNESKKWTLSEIQRLPSNTKIINLALRISVLTQSVYWTLKTKPDQIVGRYKSDQVLNELYKALFLTALRLEPQ